MSEREQIIQEVKQEIMQNLAGHFGREKERKLANYRQQNAYIQKGRTLFTGSSLMEQFPITEFMVNSQGKIHGFIRLDIFPVHTEFLIIIGKTQIHRDRIPDDRSVSQNCLNSSQSGNQPFLFALYLPEPFQHVIFHAAPA